MSRYDWLAAMPQDTVFTVFDTETTGLEPRTNHVVEIGGLRFDGRGVISRFNVLVNPGVPMPPEVTRINGITDAMLAKQPFAASVLPDFLRFIGDTVLIAHNAPFDVSFVNEELARLSLPPLKNRVVDTLAFAKDIFPGLPKYALQTLAARFGITAIDAHRAEDDARVCMELFLVCNRRLAEILPAGTNAPGIAVMPAATAAPPSHSARPETAAAKIAPQADETIDLFGDEDLGLDSEIDEDEFPDGDLI